MKQSYSASFKSRGLQHPRVNEATRNSNPAQTKLPLSDMDFIELPDNLFHLFVILRKGSSVLVV